MPESRPQVVSYGGGTNSVAMLIGLHRHGERPDAIVFSDTGGEKPHTYGHLWEHMQPWCERVGFPSITVVRGSMPQQIKDGSLENECLRLGALPSKAYGFGSCSEKWKINPYEKWSKQTYGVIVPIRLIGFHAGEPERAARQAAYAEDRRYPLIEWDWDYEECRVQIMRAGIALPGKSACFFCPSTKKAEILELKTRYPDLLARALEIERKAMAGEGQAPVSMCGLGRKLVWRDFLAGQNDEPQADDCSDACFT